MQRKYKPISAEKLALRGFCCFNGCFYCPYEILDVDMKCSVTLDNIVKLNENEIFVFGSNLAGRHGAGAARIANLKFGALMGIGIGLINRSYALPTKDENLKTLPLSKIEEYVLDLYQKIKERKDLHFLITKIGCGLAGYNIKDIAPMFKAFIKLENCSLPEEFIKYNTKKRKNDE